MDLEADTMVDELFSQAKENEWSRNDEIGSSSLLPRPITEERDETRFRKPITDADIASVQESSVPKSTEKQTEWSMKLGKSWSSNRKSLGAEFPDRPPHLLSLEALNQWLCKFILEVRQKDGKEYPPITLYQIACGILQHVQNMLHLLISSQTQNLHNLS